MVIAFLRKIVSFKLSLVELIIRCRNCIVFKYLVFSVPEEYSGFNTVTKRVLIRLLLSLESRPLSIFILEAVVLSALEISMVSIAFFKTASSSAAYWLRRFLRFNKLASVRFSIVMVFLTKLSASF